MALSASHNLGITEHATFSGALAWPYIYPWPQRPAGLVETAFDELARRWKPMGCSVFDGVFRDWVCSHGDLMAQTYFAAFQATSVNRSIGF